MAAQAQATTPFDVERIRADFPILSRKVHGKPLVYLDNGASSQHPQSVIDAEADYYARHHANVHRGVHALSQEATDLFEGARDCGAMSIARRACTAAPACPVWTWTT